jgi:ABC-2 type transport system permease protein
LIGYVYLLPAALLPALMLSALGLFLSSVIRQLENFAGVMNFIVFPMFFLSSALYPLWKMRESNELIYQICAFNPFTHGIELIRFALYGQFNLLAFSVCAMTTLVFLALAILGYDPKHGLLKRKAGAS